MSSLTGYAKSLKEIVRQKAPFIFAVFLLAVFSLYAGVIFKSIQYLLVAFFLTIILQMFFLINKSYALYVVRTCLLICICFEWVFGRMNKIREANDPVEINDNWFIKDPVLGFKLSPGLCASKAMLLQGNDTIYNVTYSSDQYGRRILNGDSTQALKNRHAVFLGCSFTFGHGLPENQTFPVQFQNVRNNFEIYDYGFEAYAPNQVALQFKPGLDLINKTTVSQDTGIAVYTFINDHLDRVYGGSIYLSYAPNTPDVFVNNNQIEIRPRSHGQIRKAKLLNNIQTLKHFNFNFYYPGTTEFYKRFASIVNYCALKYKESFPNGTFYTVIYPVKDPDLAWLKFLDPSIVVIRVPLPSDYEKNQRNYLLDPNYDQHPTGALNKYYANYISKFIK